MRFWASCLEVGVVSDNDVTPEFEAIIIQSLNFGFGRERKIRVQFESCNTGRRTGNKASGRDSG